MDRRSLIICFACLTALLVGGCNGAMETDQVAYVLMMGIDKGEGDKLNITYQIAIPRELSNLGGNPAQKVVNVTFSVLSIGEARNLLDSVIALTPAVYHVKAIVFGEELARKGVGDTLGPLMRYREYRGAAFMMIARGTAENFIRYNEPPLNPSPAKYFEFMMQDSVNSGMYIRSTLHNFYLRLKQGQGEAYVVLGGVNDNQLQNSSEKNSEPLPGRKESKRRAGFLPRSGADKVEFVGMALFSGDKMVGELDSTETRIFNILQGQLTEGILSLDDPLAPDHQVTIQLRAEKKPEIQTGFTEEGFPVIRIEQEVEASIISIASGIHYESQEYQGLLEEAASRALTEDGERLIVKTQKVHSDVLGLGQYVAIHFATWPKFREYQWVKQYPKAKISLKMTVKVRRTGLMWQTYPFLTSK